MSRAATLIESMMEVDSKFLSAVTKLAQKFNGGVDTSKSNGVVVVFRRQFDAENFWNAMADEFETTFPNATPHEVPGDPKRVFVSES